LVCNLQHDCLDGSDEHGCVNVTCRPGEFVCADNSRCLPSVWQCDGSEDCSDGSDEKGCASKVRIHFKSFTFAEISRRISSRFYFW
jgi:hypothetical protein